MPRHPSTPTLDHRPPSKRTRTSSNPGHPSSSSLPSPSTTYFFEDGNVLLHVESTLYKVHRSSLEKSEVFADTLLVGSNKGGEGELATIQLPGDLVIDWDVMLRAMYDGLSFVSLLPTLRETRSLLLLADKYNHSSVLAIAIHAFKARVEEEKTPFFPVLPSRKLPPSPYEHDDDLSPRTSQTLAALISLGLAAGLPKSIYSWCFVVFADQPAATRTSCIFGECEVDGWILALDRDSIKSILLRIDQIAILSAQAGKHHKDPKIHSSECRHCKAKRGTSCRSVLSSVSEVNLLPAAAPFVPILQVLLDDKSD